MTTQRADIRSLFEPRGVAVIGASHEQSKIGYRVVANILADGYTGRVYPINPKGGKVLGLTMCESVEKVDGPIDVACIVIPAKFVHAAVESCGKKGVKHLVVISSGFSEIGNVEEEHRITECARSYGMRLLGPNILGIYSAAVSLNAMFGPAGIRKGGVAIVSQSGALGLGMIGKTSVENIGMSAIVSVGNKADLDEADLLEYLGNDPNTRAILMYIEGVKDGERFIRVLSQTTRVKPVVVVKSGRSKRGAVAAASHTGSLAGSDEVFGAIMRQCGVLRAESIQDAFDWCKFLAAAPVPRGENSVIITNGGGIGVMATDACEKYGIPLYDDQPSLKEIFSPVTPEFGSTKNPVDLTGGARAENYTYALDAALKNPDIHSVMSLFCETAVFDVTTLSEMVEKCHARYQAGGKPFLFSALGGEITEKAVVELRKRNVPVFSDVYDSISCLGALYSLYRTRREEPEKPEDAPVDVPAVEAVIAKARSEGRGFLLAHEGQAVMRAAGIAVPKSVIARGIDEAVKAAEGMGYPVVMKVVSRDILHKSDVGGIALHLENKGEVMDAYQVILRNCREHQPDAKIDGMEIAEEVRPGTELIAGARRDKVFGPIIMFGLGGIYVEVMKDVAFRALPLGRRQIMDMIKEIRAYPLLLGVRGEEQKDIGSLVETIVRLGAILKKCPGISDIEINPVRVYEQGAGAKAVDVRILLSKGEAL